MWLAVKIFVGKCSSYVDLLKWQVKFGLWMWLAAEILVGKCSCFAAMLKWQGMFKNQGL